MKGWITWEQLLVYLAVFLFVYYAVVLGVCFRKELQGAVKRKTSDLAPFTSPASEPVDQRAADDRLYHLVHELMEDCKPVFQAAAQQQPDRQDVLAALRVRVQAYPPIRGTAFQVAITHHLAQELAHRLGLTLTEEEADHLWR